MPWLLHALFVRHHLTPGDFYAKSYGEQRFLLAALLIELDDEAAALAEAGRDER